MFHESVSSALKMAESSRGWPRTTDTIVACLVGWGLELARSDRNTFKTDRVCDLGFLCYPYKYNGPHFRVLLANRRNLSLSQDVHSRPLHQRLQRLFPQSTLRTRYSPAIRLATSNWPSSYFPLPQTRSPIPILWTPLSLILSLRRPKY